MTSFPKSPRLIKGGMVLIDVDTSVVQRVIALQYNPVTLTRTLQLKRRVKDHTDWYGFTNANKS